MSAIENEFARWNKQKRKPETIASWEHPAACSCASETPALQRSSHYVTHCKTTPYEYYAT